MRVRLNSPPAPARTPRRFDIEITNQDVKGQDGTLADDAQYQVGRGSVYAGDADPSMYTGSVRSNFPCVPGTYYFQFTADTQLGADCGVAQEPGTIAVCNFRSDVFSFSVVVPPPPPPAPPPPPPGAATPTLTISEAKAEIRRSIRSLTKREPRDLRRPGCRRVSRVQVHCDADWYDRLYIWAGTWVFRASGDRIRYRFTGSRARLSCVRRGTVRACRRTVRLP